MRLYLRWIVAPALICIFGISGVGCGGSDRETEAAFQETPPDPQFRQNIRNSERAQERRSEFSGGGANTEAGTGQQ